MCVPCWWQKSSACLWVGKESHLDRSLEVREHALAQRSNLCIQSFSCATVLRTSRESGCSCCRRQRPWSGGLVCGTKFEFTTHHPLHRIVSMLSPTFAWNATPSRLSDVRQNRTLLQSCEPPNESEHTHKVVLQEAEANSQCTLHRRTPPAVRRHVNHTLYIYSTGMMHTSLW